MISLLELSIGYHDGDTTDAYVVGFVDGSE